MSSLSSWALLKKLTRDHLLPHRKMLVIAVACMIVAAISTALLASYLKPIFNDIFIARKKELLWYVAGGVFSIFLMKGFSEYGSTLCLESVGQKIALSLQKTLFSHLIFLDISFFRQQHEGHVTSLLVNDTRTFKDSILQTLSGLIKEGLTVVSLIFVMVRENYVLTGSALLGLPLVMSLLVICGRRVRGITASLSQGRGLMQIFLQQVFQNITLVKACNTELQEIEAFSQKGSELLHQSLQVARIRAFIHPMMEILGGVAIVTVILTGGMQVIQGTQTTGSFLTFITALFFIYKPMKNIIHLNTHLQEGLAAAQRIQEVMENHQRDEAYTFNSSTSCPSAVFRGGLAFENVTFGYPGTQPLLRHFSCSFPPQKCIALVGPSGAGKTTLFHLLLRFYRPREGRLLWGGVDLSSISLEELRRHIALVSQDIALFDESLAYNIAYGRPHASREEIEKAAALAFADEFIQHLPHGYETKVGPRGVRLSGGQRQRIALARAFLSDAPLILLDEATSALDTISEKKIQQATQTLVSQRTTLMIAHRLSTVEKADLILVMNKGEIVEQGTHRQLLDQQGLYYRLALAREVLEHEA